MYFLVVEGGGIIWAGRWVGGCVFFFGCCEFCSGRFGFSAGRWGAGYWGWRGFCFCFSGLGELVFSCFFSPSFSASPLSLLLFRLVVVFISSWILISVFFVFVSFFFFPPFTRVQPSFLSGWTSVSWSVLSFASVVVLDSVVSLVAVVVLFVTMVVAFWGHDREKCPSCLQFQQSGFLPSTMTVIVVVRYAMVWGIALNPPLSRIIVNEKSPYAVPCADVIGVYSSTPP